jgi:hypothetical protein
VPVNADDTRPHRGKYALHAKALVGGAEGSQGGPPKTIRYALPPDFGPVLWGRPGLRLHDASAAAVARGPLRRPLSPSRHAGQQPDRQARLVRAGDISAEIHEHLASA